VWLPSALVTAARDGKKKRLNPPSVWLPSALVTAAERLLWSPAALITAAERR
jgi:hypothetical protein